MSKYVRLDSTLGPRKDGQVRVSYEVYADTIEEFVAAVREAARGLTDASVDSETRYDCSCIMVNGYRPATLEELASQRTRQDAAYARLRAEYEAETAARAGHHA